MSYLYLRRNTLCFVGLLAVMAFAFSASADDKKPEGESKEPPAPKPKTFTAEKGKFKLELPIKGVFESKNMQEVLLQPDSWSQFQVIKAVPHGTRVAAGDQLVWLDLAKIDEAIRETEQAQAAAELAHKLAVEDLRFFEKLVPLDLAAAEQAKTVADEDLRLYQEKEKGLALESVDQNFKQSQHQVEYTEEELKQLEKMYRAKDLTEDTEELILKRQRRDVERAKFFLKIAEASRDRQLQKDIPRRERSLVEAAQRGAINFEKTAITLPMQLRQRKLQIEQAARERQKATEKLDKLRKDRDMMVIKAPMAGIVFYGRCQKGQFGSGAGAEQQLQPAGMLAPNQVFMTIVDPKPLFVRGTIEEKDRYLVKAGQAGKMTPVAYPDDRLAVKVTEVAEVPSPTGGFQVLLTLTENPPENKMFPAMAITAQVTVYQKDDVISVPETAVFKEEDDEDQRFVYVSTKKDGKYVHEKRTVKVGKKSGSKLEILEGLAADEKILQAKPEN